LGHNQSGRLFSRPSLFFTEKYPYRNAFEIEFFPELIFKIIAVWIFYIIGIISKKSKTWNCCGYLRYKFNLD
jgi:hypothetical protein